MRNVGRRIGLGVFVGGCVAVLGLPAIASAGAKVVYAGPPPVANRDRRQGARRPASWTPKSFVKKYQPDFNALLPARGHDQRRRYGVVPDRGFSPPIDLPGSAAARDLPFIVPGATVHGVKDAAGNPFWFNGKVPSLGLDPALFAPSTATTYDGTARVDSGLPLGPPKPLNVQFTKPGVYKFFCDVHYGMA